jgi:hypothetical protein
LAPSHIYLFPKCKLFLTGQLFSSNQEVIAAVEVYFVDLMKNHYRDGIMALKYRWSKCISLNEDYVEGSLLHLQGPATLPILRQLNPKNSPISHFLKIKLLSK